MTVPRKTTTSASKAPAKAKKRSAKEVREELVRELQKEFRLADQQRQRGLDRMNTARAELAQLGVHLDESTGEFLEGWPQPEVLPSLPPAEPEPPVQPEPEPVLQPPAEEPAEASWSDRIKQATAQAKNRLMND